ncbi:ATP binding protein [Ceraceosorus bombacis]|uniref:ATP binding protein n=1 Tax=Ceraceosorus bombacis TaxID=401625 RepID=A0A0P1B903_9BASI|nr:ATP binding protein [Ceraceosorus bombacis]
MSTPLPDPSSLPAPTPPAPGSSANEAGPSGPTYHPSFSSNSDDHAQVVPSIHADGAGRGHRSRVGARQEDDLDEDAEEDDDAIFEQLEQEADSLSGEWKEKRLRQMREEAAEKALFAQSTDAHGKFTEPSSEKDLMRQLAENDGVVVHFYKADFKRCGIVDRHLDFLAPLHPRTLFLKISVFNSPFLVHKLSIQTLPCIVLFGSGGKVLDQIVGFEDLGNKDEFGTGVLEWRLGRAGILTPRAKQQASQPVLGFGSTNRSRANDDDWD